MPIALDSADLKILSALQDDASLSTVELADLAGVSQSVCWRRIQRLKDEGVIRRQVTLLDRDKLGLETQIFAEVKLSAHGRANLSDFSDAIRAFPEVMECYLLLGAVDFLLRVVTENIRAYETFFFEKLSRLPGIQEVNSIVVFSEVKATTSLPLAKLGPATFSKADRAQV
jgi:Lrp/AsnC family transcriptional regulator